MNLKISLQVNRYSLMFFFLAMVLCTVARISLLLLAPLVVLYLIYELRLSIRIYAIVLFCVLIVSFLISLFNGFYFSYNLLSFFYILPFILFLFSKPKREYIRTDLFASFFKMLAFWMVINNIAGILQYIYFPNDDSFMGVYGRFTVTQNGLSILNFCLFYYYFRKYQLSKKRNELFFSLFFILCAVMGFYGAGTVAFLVAISLCYFRLRLTLVIRNAFIFAFVLGAVYYLTGIISPRTLEYNKNIVRLFMGKKQDQIPRKILSYRNYWQGYTSDWKDMVFGSGPGTFNSRSAFTIGSPSYFTSASLLKSESKPYYFENFAYTLWNPSNTTQYQEGFMNQPFSSLLAFLGEYGLLFTLLFFYYYYKQYNEVRRYDYYTGRDVVARELHKFIALYLALLLVIDNYAEYPEITILLITIMKVAETTLMQSYLISRES
jgi:hypothetical protein